jgi:hypothetical protein
MFLAMEWTPSITGKPSGLLWALALCFLLLALLFAGWSVWKYGVRRSRGVLKIHENGAWKSITGAASMKAALPSVIHLIDTGAMKAAGKSTAALLILLFGLGCFKVGEKSGYTRRELEQFRSEGMDANVLVTQIDGDLFRFNQLNMRGERTAEYFTHKFCVTPQWKVGNVLRKVRYFKEAACESISFPETEWAGERDNNQQPVDYFAMRISSQ